MELVREFVDIDSRVNQERLKDRLLEISHQAMGASDELVAHHLGPYGSIHLLLEFNSASSAAA
eukprot:SAG31_NODE_33015_length_349_cov_0.604000_1_plen_62_part_01